MDSLSKTVTLLILTSREDEAEGLIKSLRNAGLAVRGIFTSDPEQLEGLASSDPFELILCCEHNPTIDLPAWLSRYQELALDAPLVVIVGEATESVVRINALRAGARDVTEKGNADHLQLVVARELSDFQHRRNESRLRERLEECEKRSRDLVDATVEAVAFIKEGIHVQVNPAYQELFGFDSADDLDGFPLLDLIAADSVQQVKDTLRAVERGETIAPAEIDVQCLRADDERFEIRLSVSRSQLEGEPCVRIMAEVQASVVAQPVPESLDADTSFPNRTALMAELESRIAQTGGENEPFALIFAGINIFAKLRQDRGLTGSFKAATRFGTLLHDLAPEETYLARVADDGFVLLIAGLRQASALELAAKIRQKVRLPIDLEPQKEDKPQCGTGVVLVDSNESSPADLLDAAYRDYMLGMLEAQPGPSAAGLPALAASTNDKASSEEERRLVARIQHALDNDDFQLVYQPIVSLKGDSQESYSVLVRLREDDNRLREAKDFLSTAIKSGKMAAIDRWVIRNAITELAEQRSKGQKINFFVNIAEETLQEEKLLIWICDCLRETQARGNWLTLQVPEQDARRHAMVFAKLTEGLRKVSCRVSLNRFGEGPNPDVLLRSLSLDYVKFLPELGRGLADDKSKQRRLQELTKLCRDAGVKSVVTGVEDARSLTMLWTAGIDYVEGFFLQRPSPSIGSAR